MASLARPLVSFKEPLFARWGDLKPFSISKDFKRKTLQVVNLFSYLISSGLEKMLHEQI